jgi:DNA polymerase III epsilon subunit-like protein
MMSVRDDCEEWARDVLADPATVILDTETTGLHGYACEITVHDGTTCLIDTLVDPQVPVEPGARQIHGITPEELTGAPVFGVIWPALAGILASRRVVVYNAPFDSGVIRREVQRLGHVVPALEWECAMRRYSDWYWDMDGGRFMRLHGGHRAKQDCEAVFERLRLMAGA